MTKKYLFDIETREYYPFFLHELESLISKFLNQPDSKITLKEDDSYIFFVYKEIFHSEEEKRGYHLHKLISLNNFNINDWLDFFATMEWIPGDRIRIDLVY